MTASSRSAKSAGTSARYTPSHGLRPGGHVRASPPRTMSDQAIQRLREHSTSVYMGNTAAVDRVIVCLLARGHILIEDVPGVGKTVLANALARSIECTFTRMQCTPDLLPSDIIGVTVYDRDSGEFQFKPGPIFHNIIVADEINRTTPRTQSALLEAMSETSISVEGRSYGLPQPFMVVATQNPYEFAGTYFLPENQLDRFLMRISLGYPAPSDEMRIIEKQPARTALTTLKPVMTGEEVLHLQNRVDMVSMEQALVDYVIALASATRQNDDLQVGVSPRGALALAQAARATAVLHGRDFAVPEDIVSNVLPVCSHRVISKTYMHAGDTASARRVIQQVLETVPSPA
jgi:MoxR-like ATPase